MSAADSIARLRAIAARLLEREDGDGAWFAAALARYEAAAAHGLTFDQALGLQPGPGERGWWVTEALEHRDEILRRIATRHFPGRSARASAQAIVTAVTRYEAVGWRRHRAFLSPPPELVGTLRGELFHLLRLGAPISARTVERALRHELPDSVAHRQASTTCDTEETDDGDTGESDDETTSRPSPRAA